MGVLLVAAAAFLAITFELFGPGFISSAHPPTPPELADQGATINGAVQIAVLPMMLLTLLGIAGVLLLTSSKQEANRALVKRTSVLLVSLATVVVAILALFLLTSRRPPPLPIALAHTGYTNGPAGARLAAFTVTNQGRKPIERGRFYWIESRSDPGHPTTIPPFPHLPSATLLRPGQSESVLIPVPAASGEWRVALDCRDYGWRQHLNAWLSRPSGAIVPSRWRSVPISVQRVRSNWIGE
jgi:hypothetical protein